MVNEKTTETAKKILLVDDEQLIRSLVKQILERQGYEITTAENGKAGFGVFAKNPEWFGLVIMDLNMPIWDGQKTFKKMKRVLTDVNVLFISAYFEPGEKTSLLERGAFGCLTKPFNLEDLIDKVRSVLG
ncbi:MAG: response regulator [Candidatus Aenigmarchaeota archaeon]|nr:response regulator [Candidatus Aenigmarchaeota archaeon]